MNTNESLDILVLQNSNRFAILDLLDDGLEDEFPISKKSQATSTVPAENSSKRYNYRIVASPGEGSKEASNEDPFQLSKRNAVDPYSRWTPRRQQHEPQERFKIEPLCAPCQSIFQYSPELDEFGDGTEKEHHSEHTSFKNAVEAGCYVCSLLDEKIAALVRSHELGGEGSQGLEPQFEYLRYEIIHEELEPYINFTYCERNGNTYHRILSLRLLYISGKLTSFDLKRDMELMLFYSEVEAVLHATSITNSTSTERNMELVRYWLQQCRNEHEKCRHMAIAEKMLPTRLIEIESVAGVDNLRLCNGASLSPSTPYLTLSHCWGREPIFTLVNSNIKLLSKNIDNSRLPKVFQDAILMTNRLGSQHLWIDSLCIIQDSHEDWLREAPRMGEVYRNATCNLAATGFSDGRNGLFATRNGRLLSPLKVYVDWNGMSPDGKTQLRGQYYLSDSSLWKDSVSNAPLNRRAWVVQERVLSPRIIHFGAKQLFWECYELKASEAFPNGFNYKIYTGNDLKRDIHQSDSRNLYKYWQDVVEAYSKGRLTFNQDKLPALAGIAMDLWKTLHDRYIAGLWEGDLIHSLLWSISNSSGFILLPSKYRAPTWSWASIDAEISYMYATRNADFSHLPENDPEEIIHSSIVAANCTYFTGDPTSITVQWSLRIKGPLRRAMKGPEENWFIHFQTLSWLRWVINLKEIEIDLFLDVPSYSDKNVKILDPTPVKYSTKEGPFVRTLDFCLLDPAVDHIFLLPIRSDWEGYSSYQVEMYGLVLYSTGRNRGEFQRIGAFIVEKEEHRKVVLESSDELEEQYFEEMDESGQYTITIV